MERIFRSVAHVISASAVAITFGLGASTALAQDSDLGTWLNSEKKGKIQLRECANESLCGNIVWLKEPLDENGNPWRDMLNPDRSQRSRPVVGMDVMIGTKKIAPNTWQGQIYDPEVGKTYYLKHLKVGANQVEIKGCLPSGWPCRTKYWTKAQPVDTAPPVAIAKAQPRQPAPRVAAAPPPPPATRNVAPPPAPQNVAPPPAPRNAAPVPPPAPRVAAVPRPAPAAPAPRPVQPRQPEVTSSVPPSAMRSGGYLVQVAARQSRNEAMQAFSDLQRQYPQLLGGLAPEILRADLGQRGIWYRVGVGPMLQQQAALNFCNQLKSAGADCLIRRR